jgi:hypothetical protein
MDERLLREIAADYLVPFFSGARLRRHTNPSSPSDDTVAFLDRNSIAFKVEKKDAYRLILTRPQPYADPQKPDGVVVPEISVVQAFVAVVSSMAHQLTTPLKQDLLSTFQRHVVAIALGSTDDHRILLSGIDLLTDWANRLYEGSPIAGSIGFRHNPQDAEAIQLSDFGKNDFGAVVSNGHDTLLEFDFDGRFIQHLSLTSSHGLPRYCPLRQAPIAEWTGNDHKRRRVAFALNRLGEILAFRDKQLLFARRSGRWRFLTHSPIVSQMGNQFRRELRREVYKTCLDASFARTGACIGMVDSARSMEWLELLNPEDSLDSSTSVKVKAIRKMVKYHTFPQLDRRLRQELVAIDGATLLSEIGELLAVGAILKIPAGSQGGGRLAAAKVLGNIGLGIKVSQDGSITGFRAGKEEAAFRLM